MRATVPPRPRHTLLVLACLLHAAVFGANAAEQGNLTGGVVHQVPSWFKLSFLDIAADARESADAGRHALLFIGRDECPYCAAMLRESFVESHFVDYIRANFDCIELNTKGDRMVDMTAEVSLPENELVRRLGVRYTPTIIFLDEEGQPVLRLNGYRSPAGFKHALDFVQTRAYESSDLSEYILSRTPQPAYAFRSDDLLTETRALDSAGVRPVAVLFEDQACDECNAFHDHQLADPEVRRLLSRFLFVRLDADSDAPLVDVQGSRTTARQWARTLGLTYRPGMVLFDGGTEIVRVDGMLKTFHLSQVLRYVAEDRYLEYPNLRDFARAHQNALLEAGVDIDLWR